MKNYSLKQVFIFLVILVGLLPSLISISFLLKQIKMSHQQQSLNKEKLQKSINYTISSQINQIENKLEMLINSSELTDYFRTPGEYRNLVENRLYGKGSLFIDQSQIPFFIMIQDLNKKPLLTIGRVVSDKSTMFSKSVFLNDLNMPQGRIVGYVTAIIDVSYIFKSFPEVSAVHLKPEVTNSEKLKIIFNNDSEENPTLLPAYLSILILITFIVFGFILLKRQIFEPIRSLTNKLLESQSEINIEQSKNEINYLSQVTEEYGALVRKKELKQVSAQVAHDIRSPVIALKNYLHNDGFNKEIAEKALKRIEDLAKKLGNKRFGSNKKAFSPLMVIQDLIQEYSLHSKAEIEVVANKVADSDVIDANVSEFCAAISNIIDNSIDACLKPKISISLAIKNQNIIIVISDNGPGIKSSENILKQGFTTKKHGSGLGLFQVNEFVKSVNGNIEIESDSDGTIIKLDLPLKDKNKIIIIDDDELYLKISKIRLSQLGYESILFSSKKDLYSFVNTNKEQKYDVYVDQNIDIENDGLDVKSYLEKFTNLNVKMNSSYSDEGKRDWSYL